MILDKNGYITRFYKWTYGSSDYYLPNNFCNYFWAVLFALLILPLTIISFPFQYFTIFDMEDNIDWKWYGRVGVTGAIAFCSGILFLTGTLFYENPVTSFIVLGLGTMCTFSLWLLFRENSSVKSVTSEIVLLASEKTKSVKEKYCPKIEWTNEEKDFDPWNF